MKRSFFLIAALFIGLVSANAQIYMTKNGFIRFFSTTPVENIEAKNNQVSAALDLKGNAIVYKVLIKSFTFEKALMQEHFNENYMESDKYPNAMFKGKITNYKAGEWVKDGIHKVNVEGELSIHGVTNKVSTPATIEIKGGKAIMKAVFSVKLADYKIEVPATVRKQIAETIEITVDVTADKLDIK